ncbi:MAG: ribonuclease T2 family protein [Pikeienuella sp.]
MSRFCMTLALSLILCVGLLGGQAVWAKGEKPGVFDYYVAAFSWSPSWCARVGDDRGVDQCDDRHDYGFILHGLWPQNERGWPSYCPTDLDAPTASVLEGMVDIMGSTGLARHEWKKHGVCSGMSVDGYFEHSRRAYELINLPRAMRDLKISPATVERAIIDANPTLEPDGVTVTCRDGYIAEVRICLTRDLEPRACAPDARRDCRAGPLKMPAVR